MSQEVIEITEREIEVIEVVEKGPAGPVGPQANINYTVVSSPQTLSNSQNVAADTSGGSFTLTLPANPSAGDSIDIFDYSETFDTNPLTIARNGENIESIAEDLICNVEGAYFTMIYTGSTRGWQILPRYGTTGGGGESVLTTEGDMVYRGAAINERLPIGSAGQILKVNSGGNAPEWGTAPATGVISVGVTGSDGIEVDSGSPVTGSGTIALGVNAATLRSHINVADGAEVNVQADWDATTGDAAILNKPSTFTPSAHTHTAADIDSGASEEGTFLQSNGSGGAGWDNVSYADLEDVPISFTPAAHASSHATGGSDAIAPSDIGAQSLFTSEMITLSGDTTLSAARAKIWTINNFSTSTRILTLPTSPVAGDVAIIQGLTLLGNVEVFSGSTLATLETGAINQRYRFVYTTSWALDPVPTHAHFASQIVSGTLAHERGGLEADVSAYDGLVKISGGSTSAVTISSAGEALLDDADASAQRTTLGLGNSATLDTGTTAGTVAAGDHSHELNALDATGATDGHVLTADGAGGAAFEALPSTALNDLSNVSAAAPSDNDVLVFDNATSTWVAEAPAAGGIAETLLDAKGDLIVASAADTAARLAVGSNGTMLVADSGETTGVKWAAQPVEYVVACSDETTDLTTGTAKVTFRAPVAFLLTAVAASVNTAPTGSTIIVDINNGANSALSTKLSIDASEKTSATAASAAVIDTSYDDFAADAEITIDIDQVGSTVAGKGLKVILKGNRA